MADEKEPMTTTTVSEEGKVTVEKPGGGVDLGGVVKPEVEGTEEKKPSNDDPTALRAEAERWRNEAERQAQSAESARSFVDQLTTSLHEVAREPNRVAPTAEEITERLQADPVAVLDAHFRSRVAPLEQTLLNNQAAMARQLVAERLGDEEWSPYAEAVDAFMQDMPPCHASKSRGMGQGTELRDGGEHRGRSRSPHEV